MLRPVLTAAQIQHHKGILPDILKAAPAASQHTFYIEAAFLFRIWTVPIYIFSIPST